MLAAVRPRSGRSGSVVYPIIRRSEAYYSLCGKIRHLLRELIQTKIFRKLLTCKIVESIFVVVNMK